MKRAAVLGLGVVLSGGGCGEGTAPPPPADAVDVTIEFCASSAPMWVAYKNEGREWLRPPHAPFQASFTFPATPRVTFATGTITSFGDSFVRVWNVTAAEAQHFRCVPNPAEDGTVQMNGTLKTLHDQDMVIIAGSVGWAGGRTAAYALQVEASGEFDLVAELIPATTDRRGLTIISRAIPAVSGGVLPVLDFTGSEARPFDSAQVTATGLPSGAELRANVRFQTARGTVRDLFSQDFSRTGVLTVRSFPSPPQSSDVHEVGLWAFGGEGETRVVRYATDAVKDTTVAFGPAISLVALAQVDSTPFQRFTTRLQRQAEYGSIATAFYRQDRDVMQRVVVVTTTAAYAGAAVDWNLDLPDFTKAPDFPMSWAFHPPYSGVIDVVASDEPLGSRLGTAPRAQTVREVRAFHGW